MSPWRMEHGSESLGNLRSGRHAAVLGVGYAGKGMARLMELGFMPGADVEVISEGDTMLVRLGDQRMCLRKDSADEVSVMALD